MTAPKTLQARSPTNATLRSPGRSNQNINLQNLNARSPGQHSKLGLKTVLKKTQINTNVQ